jgi:hypothetical protein
LPSGLPPSKLQKIFFTETPNVGMAELVSVVLVFRGRTPRHVEMVTKTVAGEIGLLPQRTASRQLGKTDTAESAASYSGVVFHEQGGGTYCEWNSSTGCQVTPVAIATMVARSIGTLKHAVALFPRVLKVSL